MLALVILRIGFDDPRDRRQWRAAVPGERLHEGGCQAVESAAGAPGDEDLGHDVDPALGDGAGDGHQGGSGVADGVALRLEAGGPGQAQGLGGPGLGQADDGWYEWVEDGVLPLSVAVRVRIEEAEGRLRVVGLQVDGRVSAELLRSVPVGRIEAAANAQLRQGLPATPPARPRARIRASLRSNAVQGYPDAFYAEVAKVYRHLVTASSRPVGDLAEANDVPVTTAQRWVKEARRRRLLAPGHPGKAG